MEISLNVRSKSRKGEPIQLTLELPDGSMADLKFAVELKRN